MNILMIAPMPTHPATQGSRQRAFDMARAFQKKGDSVTFLYWAAEGLEPGGRQAMAEAWDDVQIVSCDGHVPRRSNPAYFGIDDWYHEAIGERIKALRVERTFDACVVNYVWLSRALLALPDDCVKIIDTHDLFGDRAEKFTAIGRRPEWYYTSIPEERRGLDRADLVIAIQAEEAIEAQRRTNSEVSEVGFLARPYPVRRRRKASDAEIIIGYIGSSNPFNVTSLVAFCEGLSSVDIPTNVRFVAAGPICDVLQAIPMQPFELLGRVPNLDDFYAAIDIALNPMMGGTGLKIKTVEALAHGVGLIGTVSAFTGIPTDVPEQGCRTIEQVVQAVEHVWTQPGAVDLLRKRSMSVFESYISTQERHFSDIYKRIGALRQARLAGVSVDTQLGFAQAADNKEVKLSNAVLGSPVFPSSEVQGAKISAVEKKTATTPSGRRRKI